MPKNLIAYFSRAGNNYVNGLIKYLDIGNTERAAVMIKELINGDLYCIEPKMPYSEDYYACIDEAKNDLNTNARPQFTNPLDNIDGYDVVYLCYPNYWGTMPMHVWTFLEKYDFSDMTIKPLCTHEGSGMGRSESDIKKLCPDSHIEQGLAIMGGSVEKSLHTIKEWVEQFSHR